MIPCIKELKLNQYKAVHIPSNSDYYARFGERVTLPSSPDGTQAVFNATKLDGYHEAQKVVDKFLLDEQEAYEAQQAEFDRLKAIAEAKENQTV